MRSNDRGATLIEIVMTIVLLGMFIPTVYTLIMSIDRGMQASYRREQAYQIVERAVETTKVIGNANIADSIGQLPNGYTVSVFDKGSVAAVDNLKHYQVMVYYNEQVVLTYDFYWKAA